MSICKKCNKEIPDGSIWCNWCGAKQVYQRKVKGRRSNGEGTAVKQPNGTWRLFLTEYKQGVRTVKSKAGFKTKADAFKYLPTLRAQDKTEAVTFEQAFERFIETHQRSESTIKGYYAAFKYFEPLWKQDIAEIELESLQACLDKCDKGRRTKENMKALIGLMYRYIIPRYSRMREMNMADYLVIYEKSHQSNRDSFTPEELEKIRSLIGKVDYADYVYCNCFLGFRPGELLDLTSASYSATERFFIGGSKTTAGKGRKVTVPPRIQPYVDLLVLRAGTGYVFRNVNTGGKLSLKRYQELFADVLVAAGIDNPVVNGRHRFTPHSCRHTYATMIKRIPGAPEKDILELIGHADISMTIEYQDVSLDDLRRITDLL